MLCFVHAVYEGTCAAITFRYGPPSLSFRYGLNEIRDGLLAEERDYTEALSEIAIVSPTRLRKADRHLPETERLSLNPMKKRRLIVLCNQLQNTIIYDFFMIETGPASSL